MSENQRKEYTLTYGGEDGLAQLVARSPDGTRLALGGTSGTVETWSIAPLRRDLTYTGHGGERITAISWSPDGTKIASMGPGGVVRVWDAATGLDVLDAQRQGIVAITWSPHGDHLALLHIDGTVRLASWGRARQSTEKVVDE